MAAVLHALQLRIAYLVYYDIYGRLCRSLMQSKLLFNGRPTYFTRTISSNNDTMLTIVQARAMLMEMVGLTEEFSSCKQGDTADSVFKHIPEKQDGLPVKSLQDSYREVSVPLGTDISLRSKYITFFKGIRFGRLLEDLDTFAGFICYTHNKRGNDMKSPLSTVTALVDRIELGEHNISALSDIKLTGNVTWVGRSSMEVTMAVEQIVNDSWEKMMIARFVMVARNPLTGGSAAVNPLKPNTPEEEAIFQAGERNKIIRQRNAQISLLKTPPNVEETLLIHNQFQQTIDLKSSSFKIRVKPENSVWMENTILKNLIICHPEKRNLYNKIFGGYIMRIAFELAWANAALYSKSRPLIKIMDDIAFRKPVEIGSLLFLSSQVVYTDQSKLQVKVHAEVLVPESGSREITNDFHFTFDSKRPDLPQVIPKTYAEFMLYVEGKRHYES